MSMFHKIVLTSLHTRLKEKYQVYDFGHRNNEIKRSNRFQHV